MEFPRKELTKKVQETYSSIALNMNEGATCCTSSSYCDTEVRPSVVTQKESLGCDLRLIDIANPIPGEVVIDLGSGPGHDTRKVAQLVGDTGAVIGIDFTPEMISLAQSKSQDYSNISYQQADISETTLEDNFADLIISNCVFNLVESKIDVFREAYRVLKPGGRLVISDMITHDTSAQLTESDFCACIGGSTSIEEYLDFMEEVGFVDTKAISEYESTYSSDLADVPYESVIFIGHKK